MAIIHVGINGILRSKHCEELNKLPRNIIKVGNTCQKYNIGKIYISAIVPSTITKLIFLTLTKDLQLQNAILNLPVSADNYQIFME